MSVIVTLLALPTSVLGNEAALRYGREAPRDQRVSPMVIRASFINFSSDLPSRHRANLSALSGEFLPSQFGMSRNASMAVIPAKFPFASREPEVFAERD